MPIMGKQTLYYIYQILKQASSKIDQRFGGFGIIFVGDFQQLPPVTETEVYEIDGYVLYLIYDTIEKAIVIQTSHQQGDDDPLKLYFRWILSRYM